MKCAKNAAFAFIDHLEFQVGRFVLPLAKTSQLKQGWIPIMQHHLSPIHVPFVLSLFEILLYIGSYNTILNSII